MYIFITLTYTVSFIHLLLASSSILIGIISQSRSAVWLAHNVSAIWSGVFYAFCGGLGIVCAREKGLYVILCYVALNIVTIIVDCVNIQLLRLGLVNIMTDGQAYSKEPQDTFALLALIISLTECLICLFSLTIGIRLAYDAAHKKFRKKEGPFFVQILSEKEIIVVSKAPSSKHSGSGHESIQSFD